jgi:hypothetical protein
MRTSPPSRILYTLALVGLSGLKLAAEPFTVHEWGTFTTVSGSDGKLLPGLEVEENALPPFVHSHAGFFPANKGWDRPVANVTVKMETPVLYFYSDVPRSVKVDVAFHGGSISQWYPEKVGGENLSGDSRVAPRPAVAPMDFARGYNGSASWQVDVLAPGATDKIWSHQPWDTPEFARKTPAFEHWSRARVAGANKVRGPKPAQEVDGFIFYRGIGNFALPLQITSGRDLVVSNTGAEEIPFLFVYEKWPERPEGVVWWEGALSAGSSITAGSIMNSFIRKPEDIAAAPVLETRFPAALERAGLTPEEARALMATWRESYFERYGLRVFWIVPRAFTDAVLPITISPQPEKLTRVLVGRSEVLRPTFETELKRDFAADGGKRWINDRYYRAYTARVRQLGVVLAEARP